MGCEFVKILFHRPFALLIRDTEFAEFIFSLPDSLREEIRQKQPAFGSAN